jgi:diadenosine tetraphosphatase ApaH/serine/threonine PP2A family protein phosphatase
MRIAVISDIHANLEALEAVLVDIDRLAVDAVFCLGDNIGYGAEPERVVQTLRRRGIPSVLGNHEMAVVDPKYLSWFNPTARQSLQANIDMLASETIAHIRGLKPVMLAHGCRFVHGFPPDSPFVYLFQVSGRRKREVLSKTPERITFVGHTHLLEMVAFDGRRLQQEELAAGTFPLEPDCRYIFNVGSVGQPRDGDNRAKFALWDAEADVLAVRRVAYDIPTAAAKIREAGLPEAHALRLF